MRLVERDDSVLRLRTLFEECARGQGRHVLLDGPPGSGRTALLLDLVRHAEQSGALVLRAAATPVEQSLPYGVLTQLFDSPGVPADMNGLPTVPSGRDGIPESRREVQDAFRRLAGDGRPVVITIDDLSTGDEPSLHCLSYLALRIKTAPVLLLVTDHAETYAAQNPLCAELYRQPFFHRVPLRPLTRHGVRQVLAAELGEREADRLAADFTDLSGGNLRLLHALISDERRGSAPQQAYARELLSCVRRGQPEGLAVARALAVLGDGARPEHIARLTGLGVGTTTGALDALTTAGLLDGDRFRHPAAARTLVDDLPPGQTADLHRKAAELLHQDGAPATVVADRLARAGEAGESWECAVLREAARQLLAEGRAREAVDHLTIAEASCREPVLRATVRAELADAQWQVTPFAAAAHLASSVTAVLADRLGTREWTDVVRRLAWHGRADELSRVLAHMRKRQIVAEEEEFRDLSTWLAGTYPGLVPRTQPRVAADARRLTTEPSLSAAAEVAGHLISGLDRDALPRIDAVIGDFRWAGDSPWGGEACLLALLAQLYAGQPQTALDWCDKLLADPRCGNTPAWQAALTAARAEACLRLGDLTRAAEQAENALSLITPESWGVVIGLPLGTAIAAAVRIGRLELAARHVNRPVPDALLQTRYGLHYLHARGEYAAAAGRHRAALADFLLCGERIRAWGLGGAHIVPWCTSAAEAWLHLGNRDQAKWLLDEHLARLGGGDSPYRGLALRVAAALGPAARRTKLLGEAADILGRHGGRYELALVLTELADAHTAAGERRSAQRLVRRAWHVAKSCGAERLCEQLVPEGNAGLLERSAATVLTMAERRVAALAVVGHTNREIAAMLHVTPSTVEQHLTRVFRKLDVKRREDLPAELHARHPESLVG
ncbi:AAA family ATPase [Streptomyces ipomoeae]|uniref:AAA family ATPase n=1 Tax=Streptomyces ipomoeae TaxID=103232 RepID=UPI0011467EF6|nr:LuxR family transcriptional regulator [Streptomyces ipomoeae]MDX2939353.1 AAA family ATPase [Streptomyces ipomoeae]TQE25198.1 LuxR family transcriptional regulator [Streptomyces ipomoeae]